MVNGHITELKRRKKTLFFNKERRYGMEDVLFQNARLSKLLDKIPPRDQQLK